MQNLKNFSAPLFFKTKYARGKMTFLQQKVCNEPGGERGGGEGGLHEAEGGGQREFFS